MKKRDDDDDGERDVHLSGGLYKVVRHCPAKASHYYLVRFAGAKGQVRYPAKHALRTQQPFEHPLDCSPGTWLVVYSSDSKGQNIVQHIGHRPYVEVELWLPASVNDSAEEPIPATEERPQRIAQQSTVVRDASPASADALLRAHKAVADTMAQNLVLAEKLHEAIGRISEIERAVAQRLASLPLAPNYTPVLQGIVAAIRDIGVAAQQHEEGRQFNPAAHVPTDKTACSDNTGAASTPPTLSGDGEAQPTVSAAPRSSAQS